MFLENMLTAAQQVAILYVIVAVGFLADKLKLFRQETALACTNLLFYVVTPCKVVQSFLSMEFSPQNARDLFIAAGCGILLHAIAALCSTFLFRKTQAQRAAVFQYASAYGNCGYMALPLANAVLGEKGVFFCSVVIMTFQLFAFSHGAYLMTRCDEKSKNTKSSLPLDWKKLLTNPGIISVLAGLPLFLLQVKLPLVIASPVDYIASLNTPLAMLMFGTYIANTQLRATLKEWRILGVAAFKLLLLPALLLVLLRLLGIGGILLQSIILSAAAPPANNTVLFAAKYGRDAGLAAQVVSAVSLLSIVTMPVMIGFAGVAGAS